MTHTSTAQPEALKQRLDDALNQADRAVNMAVLYGRQTSLGLEAYAAALTIRAQHAHIAELRDRVQELEEEASMYRWLRDHWHGFEHYRVDWAKSQGLFERDIKKQMAIMKEKQK